MRVIKGDNYNVYIYPEDHAPPHCHVRYKDNETESVVGLPLLNLIAGRVIRKNIKQLLKRNLEKLTRAWDTLNPIDNTQFI